MKRFLAALTMGALTSSMLMGCGAPANENNPGSSAGTDPKQAKGDSSYTMTLIISARDEFLSSMEAGAKNAASELGVQLTTQDANNDTSKMLQYIESSRNAGDDAVIVNMVDPETTQQCIDAAGDMKVVFVNRQPTDLTVLNENAVYVGSDDNASGTFQGEFLSAYFKETGKTEINYIMLNGMLSNVSTTARTESVLKTLADNGITATQAAAPLAADWNRADAMDMISPLLTTTEYDCIIANNDAMALGAVEAMISQNLDPKSIPIVGIDATVDGRQAVKDGTLAMTVFQNPDGQGRGAQVAAVNMLEGKSINDGTDYETDETGNIVWVPFEPVTPDNVDQYANK